MEATDLTPKHLIQKDRPGGRWKTEVVGLLCVALLLGGMMGMFVTSGMAYLPLMWFLALAGACAILFMMVPEYWGLLIVMAYLSVEGMLKLVSNYHPVVHLGIDILVMLLLLRWMAQRISRGQAWEWPPLFWLVAAFSAWVMIQVFHPYALGLVPSIGSFKVYLTMIPLYLLAYSTLRDEKDLRRFVQVHLAAGVLVFGTAISQYVQGPTSVAWLGPAAEAKLWQFEGYFFRPFGTTANPGGGAVYSHLVVPFALVGLWIWRGWLGRAILTLILLLAMLTLFVSQVRQLFLWSILVMLLVLLITPRTNLGRALSLLSVLGLVLGGYMLAQYLGGLVILYRFATLLDPETYTTTRAFGLEAILWNIAHIPLGSGLGRTGGAGAKFTGEAVANPGRYLIADNFWAQSIVDVGVPGSLLLTIILLAMTWQSARLIWRLRTPTCQLMAIAIAALMFTLIPFSWGASPLLGNPYTAYFWFLGGMVMRLPAIDRLSEQGGVTKR